MISVKWEELFKSDFEERIAQQAIVYLPLGLCEPHGHIAVLGLDTIKANYLCETAALRWGGIVAPVQGYQIHETGYHAAWLNRVVGNANTYMTSMPPAPILYHFLYQLRTFHNAGFKLSFIITGHAGGNQDDLRLAAKLFSKKTDMEIEVFSDPELTDGKYTGDHAGKYEISQLMYLRPELVDMDKITHWEFDKPETRFAQGEDAANATLDYGRQIINDCLDGIHNIINKHQSNARQERKIMTFETVEEVWQELKRFPWITLQPEYKKPNTY